MKFRHGQSTLHSIQNNMFSKCPLPDATPPIGLNSPIQLLNQWCNFYDFWDLECPEVIQNGLFVNWKHHLKTYEFGRRRKAMEEDGHLDTKSVYE